MVYEEVFNNLLSFDEGDISNIINIYNDGNDRLTEKVIPFSEESFGNLICFDYMNNEQPIIVFWEHEKAFINKELATTYICDCFTDLLSMVYEFEK